MVIIHDPETVFNRFVTLSKYLPIILNIFTIHLQYDMPRAKRAEIQRKRFVYYFMRRYPQMRPEICSMYVV